MTISKNIKNGITYPTEVYYQYNLYLIKEYYIIGDLICDLDILGKFLVNEKYEKFLFDISKLLEDNISHDKENTLKIIDWEDDLNIFYKTLVNTYNDKRIKNKKDIKKIEVFFRKEKLKKLNEKKV